MPGAPQARRSGRRRRCLPGWPRIRAAQLAAFPWCAQCGATATDVHHVRGRAAGDGPDNLMSLCGRCHRHITAIEAGWLSAP